MSRPILVVGSTALDSVETACGKVDDALGGSAFFFSAAAGHAAPVDLVGVVGEDFPMEEIEPLRRVSAPRSSSERSGNLDRCRSQP